MVLLFPKKKEALSVSQIWYACTTRVCQLQKSCKCVRTAAKPLLVITNNNLKHKIPHVTHLVLQSVSWSHIIYIVNLISVAITFCFDVYYYYFYYYYHHHHLIVITKILFGNCAHCNNIFTLYIKISGVNLMDQWELLDICLQLFLDYSGFNE